MEMIMTKDEFDVLRRRVDDFGFPMISFIFNKGYVYNKSVIKKTIFGCKRVGSNSIPIIVIEED